MSLVLCIEWFSIIESCIARLQDNRRCWWWWSSLHSDKTFDRTASISLFSKPKKTILICSVFLLTPYWIVTLCELHAHRTDVRNRSVSKMAPAQLNLSVVCSQANVSIRRDNEAILTNPRKCGLWASIKKKQHRYRFLCSASNKALSFPARVIQDSRSFIEDWITSGGKIFFFSMFGFFKLLYVSIVKFIFAFKNPVLFILQVFILPPYFYLLVKWNMLFSKLFFWRGGGWRNVIFQLYFFIVEIC